MEGRVGILAVVLWVSVRGEEDGEIDNCTVGK